VTLEPEPDLAGRSIGHIRIERALASGGMGAVYLGFDEALERRVAVKVIHSSARLDPEARARFRREARVLSRLDHPHICRIHDYVEGEDADLLVLELIEGTSLEEARRGPLADVLKGRIGEQVAGALAAAHAAGVVHRDLKPANVMLGADGQVKVLDFGLSRLVEPGRDAGGAQDAPAGSGWDDLNDGGAETLGHAGDSDTVRGDVRTRLGSVMGTVDYMSPEQARGEPVGPPADVYSLGLLLQVLWTGESSYEPGLGVRARLERAARGETRAMRGADRDLVALVERMKALAPSARPTALDVAARLAWIRERPARRLRRAALAAGIGVLALFAAAMAVQAWRIRQEAARASREADRARQEAAAAREVTGFLVGLFEVSDPGESRGNTVTAREILDAGAQRIDRELAGQPLTRARLMDAMGVVYTNLGLFDQALPLLQGAVDIRTARLSPLDPELATSLHDLATLFHQREEYSRAEPLYRRALRIQEQALGPRHPDVGDSLNHLAALYRGTGDYAAAVPLYERALPILEAARGRDHPDVGAVLNNLAVVYRLRGEFARAEPLYQRSLEIAQKAFGPDHPEVATSLNNLATLYRDEGRLAQARPLFERALAIAEKAQGPRHPEVATGLANLGTVLYWQGEDEPAARLLARAVSILEQAMGPQSLSLVQLRIELGRVRLAQGRLEPAGDLFARALAACEGTLSGTPEHPRAKSLAAAALVDLGRVQARRGAGEAARRGWQRALVLTRPAGDGQPVPVAARSTRAKALLLLGRLDEARPLVAALVAAGWRDPDFLSLCRERGFTPPGPG
jgi:tetratricopeptide (TPR) repeat protein